MSYKYSIINSRPLAYYPLTFQLNYGTLMSDFLTYEDYLQNIQSYGSDIPVNNFFDEIGGYSTLQTGSTATITTDILPLVSKRLDDNTHNACKITDSSQLTFSNNYKMFSRGFESSTSSIEFWLLLPESPKEKTTIFKSTDYNNNEIVEIYIFKDFAYIDIAGVQYDPQLGENINITYTAKTQIYSFNEKMHVFASYKDGQIYIAINGISGEHIQTTSDFTFSDNEQTPIKLGPAPISHYYIISDIAFYDRDLSLNEIRQHMAWSNMDSNPVQAISQGSSSYFKEFKAGSLAASKIFMYPSDYEMGSLNNLITDGSGLTISKTQDMQQVVGTWYYNFPINYYDGFEGIDISWDTGSLDKEISGNSYVSVFASYDGGINYVKVKNNKSVPLFLSTASSSESAKLMLKVVIYSQDSSLEVQPRIDNLSVKIYNKINILSDTSLFNLYPVASTTYALKNKKANILNNNQNLGINFYSEDSLSNPGSAEISVENGSTYQAIEFWFKYDGFGKAVLATSQDDVYINENGELSAGAGVKLYLNAIDISNAPKPLTIGNTYHVVCVYESAKNSTIKINGSVENRLPSECSYGYINLSVHPTTAASVQNHYLSYLTINSTKVNDGNTSIGSIIEYSGAENSVNNGKPVISYRHVG